MDTEQFEKYQYFTEKTINKLSQQVMLLENKLNMFTNLLEISKYINQYIKDPNLFPLINDMLIGVFGAKYSTIYIKSNEEYTEVTPRTTTYSSMEEEERLIMEHEEEEFVLNSANPIYANQNKKDNIYSCLGVPIKVNKRLLGFILIQHSERNYFSKDHALFLSSLGNHIGVAIDNNLLYNQIKEIAYQDGLTGIFNKRYFFETMHAKPNLKDKNYSIVMIDLDDFKSVNDTYGHPYGDIVLKRVAQIIKVAVRANDIAARYGGEEIIIFLHHLADRDKVSQLVESIREEIENTMIEGEGITSSVTASFGVYCKCDEPISLEEVIKRADSNLYISKREGKNRVTIN